MKELWDYFKSLFKAMEESSPSNPAIHELIVRTPAEQAALMDWKDSLTCRRLFDWLGNQYALWKVLPDDIDEAIDFLDTPSSKGFAIHFHKTGFSKQDVLHFFDLLKEKVLSLNYRPQISDTRTYSRKDWVETVERHFLKPKPSFGENPKLNQRFGNVTIELTLHNDAVFNLKFRATTYNDHLYATAEEFEGLMQVVLE